MISNGFCMAKNLQQADARQYRLFADLKVKVLLILAIAVLTAALPAAQRTLQQLPSRATSTIERISRKDCSGYRTTNRSYEIVEIISPDGEPVTLLLLEELRNERCEGQEGTRGNATVTAWELDKAGNKKLRWTIHSNGNTVSLDHEDLLTITEWGCCDVPVTYRFFNLHTGQLMYVTNSKLLELSGDEPTLIGFGYPDIHHPDHLPRLQLGTSTHVAQSLEIVSTRQYYDEPTLTVHRANGRNSIALKYRDGVELLLPMKGERIDTETSHLPAGYGIRLAH